jgi:hypothetical protein
MAALSTDAAGAIATVAHGRMEQSWKTAKLALQIGRFGAFKWLYRAEHFME